MDGKWRLTCTESVSAGSETTTGDDEVLGPGLMGGKVR